MSVMDYVPILIVLLLIGLCFGSFINALVWRLRNKRDMVRERSECTHCHHMLAWYDLLPVVSWLMLGGKCRYCHKSIDDSPIVELVTSGLFVLSYIAWPFEWTEHSWIAFGLWLAAVVMLVALAVYDLKWYLLPNRLVYPLVGLGVVLSYVRFTLLEQQSVSGWLVTALGGILVIAGIYWALFHISQGRWVGYGDVRLSVFIGVVLGWQGALLCLFLANLIGCVIILPALLAKKLHAKSKIPFGPFLIAACIIVFLWGPVIINWYISSAIGL